MGKGESLDTPNPMLVEFESKEIRDERLVKLFQQGYTRKNKDVIVIPPPGSNTSLNGTTMPSDNSSETNLEVHAPSPITSEIATLNLQVGDQSKRYPLRDHKKPDRLGFLKIIL